MVTGNGLLRPMPLLQMARVSIVLVATNLPVLLIIALAFRLPADLLADWVFAEIAKRFSGPAETFFTALILLAFSLITYLGYAAMAVQVGQLVEGEVPSIRNTLKRFSGRNLLRIFGTLVYQYWLVGWPVFAYAVGASLVVLALTFLGARSIFVIWVLFIIGFIAVVILSFVRRLIDYSLGALPAIFEDTYFKGAAIRSKALVKGRRVWLSCVFVVEAVVLIAVNLGATFWLADPDPHKWVGFASSLTRSIVTSLTMAAGIVFDTLIYFRLRREKHDLTFFDLPRSEILEPATRRVDRSQ